MSIPVRNAPHQNPPVDTASTARLIRRYGDEEDLSYLPRDFFSVVDELPRFLASRIAKYYPEVAQRNPSMREIPIAHSSYPIFAYRIQAPGFSRNVYIKFAPVFPDKNEGLVEYENLQRIHDHFPRGRGYGSPKPLEFIPEWNALITEGVRGTSLRTRLLRANWLGASAARRGELKRIVERCGHWLREFHSINGIEWIRGAPKFELGWMASWDRLRHWLSEAEAGDRIRDDVQRIIDDRWGVLNLPVSRKHGDLALDNILVYEGDINVLDVSYADRDALFNDVAHFVANIRTVNSLPRHVLFDRRYARTLSDIFLKAYGVSDYPDGYESLRPYLINAMLERFTVQASAIRTRFGDKLSGILTALLCRTYARLLCDIEQ